MLFNSIEETIGKTPLVRLNRIREKINLKSVPGNVKAALFK